MSLSIPHMLQNLESQEPVLGVLLLGAGLVFVIMGARVFRVLMALSFLCIGFAIGGQLPLEPVWTLLAGAVAGIGLAVVSKYFVRVGVALLAGGWLATATMVVAENIQADPLVAMILGGFAFLVAVSLVFILYYEVIAAVMSFEGTLLLLSGMIICLNHYSSAWPRLRSVLVETPALIGFLILAGTVTGYYTQIAERQKRQVGTSG